MHDHDGLPDPDGGVAGGVAGGVTPGGAGHPGHAQYVPFQVAGGVTSPVGSTRFTGSELAY